MRTLSSSSPAPSSEHSSSSSSFCWRGWPYSYFLFFYVLVVHMIVDTNNTKSSSPHWKLVVEEDGKEMVPKPIVEDVLSSTSGTRNAVDRPNGTHTSRVLPVKGRSTTSTLGREDDDLIFHILASTVVSPGGAWMKTGEEVYCPVCPMGQHRRQAGYSMEDIQEPLECGRPANFTYYDQLMGIANRHSHPQIPEPDVAIHFKRKGSKKDNIDLTALERKLRKAKKEKPSSVQLYIQIGNFNRIKGHTLRAIECFRRALAVAPNNPEVLLNLARLLFTHQYLDDSLFLARRSLELQAPDRNAWAQHFALGEILKAYGHKNEALMHFKHTLELRPDHEGAQEQLRELETQLHGSNLQTATLVIILLLAVGVCAILYSNMDADDVTDTYPNRASRHFSRALAMRSLKLGISPRHLRAKRT